MPWFVRYKILLIILASFDCRDKSKLGLSPKKVSATIRVEDELLVRHHVLVRITDPERSIPLN